MLKHPFIAFLKLIRIQNLFIIAITQYCIKYVLLSQLNEYSLFTPFLFSISLLSTLLIAGAGYIINDYFDVKTDNINRPNTVVIDKTIKRRWAMALHIFFNVLGLLFGFYLAVKCHSIALLLFQLTSILLLWFYSTHFKKQLLIGNIVVALLTAIIPLMPMVYDYYLSGNLLDNFLVKALFADVFKYLFTIAIGYSVFAFLTSLAREVIKDMEDYDGDLQTGCKTMPIAWGMITSKVVTFFIIIITIGLLLLSSWFFYKQHQVPAIYYIGIALVLPLLLLAIKISRAKNSKDFKTASLLLKFTMLFGIAFTFIINHFL